ncbi:hypothetical protein L207DRAFT_184762 [Hyaloscypha variabilis F]|uniref:Uncharacterized protein n=1 Tax=Hyaloscypha variabilis (strain UAMH 11265 / GT02V1 / F) TaxID=1149755 RepID=A0A2J6R130_HYAVF|nr:hypothetical protein L207DRAFT_184762 [Hyaloscypha variabilis F]
MQGNIPAFAICAHVHLFSYPGPAVFGMTALRVTTRRGSSLELLRSSALPPPSVTVHAAMT